MFLQDYEYILKLWCVVSNDYIYIYPRTLEIFLLVIFSLNHPTAVKIIKKYQLLLNEQSDKKQKIEVKKNAEHQKRQFGKKNMLNKLRNIENGQEEKL